MKITPKTEEHFKRRNLLDPGIYDFIVHDAIEKVSKNSGDPMIEVILKIKDMYGNVHTLFDSLMDKEPFDYKIRHLSECSDVLDKYNNGEIFASDFLGKKGKVKVLIKKDKSGQYPDRNSVQDYIKIDKNSNNFEDDSLPF